MPLTAQTVDQIAQVARQQGVLQLRYRSGDEELELNFAPDAVSTLLNPGLASDAGADAPPNSNGCSVSGCGNPPWRMAPGYCREHGLAAAGVSHAG